MNCPDEIRIEMLLNGMLDGADAEAASKHLEECARCRSIFEELKSVDDLMRTAAPVPTPEFLKSLPKSLREKAACEQEQMFSILPTVLSKIFWALTEAAAVLIVISTISLFSLLKNAMPAIAGGAEASGKSNYFVAEKEKDSGKNSIINRMKEMTEDRTNI